MDTIRPMCDVCVRDAGFFNIYMHEVQVQGSLDGTSYGCLAHERVYHPNIGYFPSNPESQRAVFARHCQAGTCTFAMYIAFSDLVRRKLVGLSVCGAW